MVSHMSECWTGEAWEIFLAVLQDNKDFLSLEFLNIQIMGLGVRLEDLGLG